MIKRKKLGIRFDIPYETATGAVIYFMNIISALRVLPDEEKPEVIAFVSPDAPLNMIKAIDYEYLTILPIKYLPKWQRALNRLLRNLVNNKQFNVLHAKTYEGKPLDGMLSLVVPSEDINTNKQLLWLADLQIYHLPENFTREEIKRNHALKVRLLKGKHDIVLCSQWCIDDFNRIFPEHQSRLHRLRFATTHPDISHLNINAIKDLYGISKKYFIVSNQFWIHKNHMAVLKAINELKKEYPELLCVITGHPHSSSPRSKIYTDGIMNYVAEQKLDQHVRFLGLIPRQDQISLMQNSMAIIQPSFFESWNTTVEDAKLMGKFIILSNLEVHKEQINDNVLFFDPNKVEDLIKCMREVLENVEIPIIFHDYNENVKQFARDIIAMLD